MTQETDMPESFWIKLDANHPDTFISIYRIPAEGHTEYVHESALKAQNETLRHRCSKMWESRQFWKNTCRANESRVEKAVELASDLNEALANRPTVWAYEQACAALKKHTESESALKERVDRAEKLEEELQRHYSKLQKALMLLNDLEKTLLRRGERFEAARIHSFTQGE